MYEVKKEPKDVTDHLNVFNNVLFDTGATKNKRVYNVKHTSKSVVPNFFNITKVHSYISGKDHHQVYLPKFIFLQGTFLGIITVDFYSLRL